MFGICIGALNTLRRVTSL